MKYKKAVPRLSTELDDDPDEEFDGRKLRSFSKYREKDSSQKIQNYMDDSDGDEFEDGTKV